MGAPENLDLFTEAAIFPDSFGPLPKGFNEADSTDEKIVATRNAIKAQLRAGKHLVVATSFGKDSGVLLMVAIQALEEFVAEYGTAPTMFVITSDTKLENPEMAQYSHAEARKVREYARAKGLPMEMRIASPGVSNNYLVNLLGGRLIASMPDAGRKCTVMMKIAPIERLKKRIAKKLGYSPKNARDNFVTLIGKRFDESEERRRNMAANGERPDKPVKMMKDGKGKQYEWVMSPIAAFTLDDIFMSIAYVRNGHIKTYSDFEQLVEIYRAANEGSCMVNVYSQGQPGKTACGSRTGCHICLQVGDDKSMANMLNEPGLSYMRPLNDFREYIKRNHYRMDKRNWLARTVNKDGTINLAPNSYSPEFCLELLRYALTIDMEEREAAWELGIEPRFQLLTVEDLIFLDCMWSRYGYQHGFMACYTARQVERGARWHIPKADPNEVYPTRMPKERRMSVPFCDSQFGHFTGGKFDIEAAMAGIDPFQLDTEDEITVDPEGAMLFWEFELDRVLEMYGPADKDGTFSIDEWAPATALNYFLRLGTVMLAKGARTRLDEMLQMSNQIHRHGLRPYLHNPAALIKRLGLPGKVLPAAGQQIDIEDQIRVVEELEAEQAAQLAQLAAPVQTFDPSQIIARG